MTIAEKSDIVLLSKKMFEISENTGVDSFKRDAGNILLSSYLVKSLTCFTIKD